MKVVCDNAVYVRWMVRRDFSAVMDIEQACFEFPWDEKDFESCLRQRNCMGMVAEKEDQIVGFMIYEILKNRIHLLNLATAPEFQKQGVAQQMIEKLIGKLVSQQRTKISLEVRETNLQALRFFRSLGFLAVRILRNFYQDTEDDAYVMQFQSTAPSYKSVSRINDRIAG